MANVIARGAAADPGDRAQQDARRPAVRRVPRVLPGQRGRVLRQLLRLLPARGLHPVDRHLHREGRARSTTRSTGCGTRRRQRCCAPRRRSSSPASAASTASARPRTTTTWSLTLDRSARSPAATPCCGSSSTSSTSATTWTSSAGTFRVRGDAIEIYPPTTRRALPHRVVRRRGRAHHRGRPADRRGHRATPGDIAIYPGDPLRHAARTSSSRSLTEIRRRARGAARAVRGAGQARSRRSACASAPTTTSR